MTNTAPTPPSYAGEFVDVGIDVHKHTDSVSCVHGAAFVAELLAGCPATFQQVVQAHQAIWRALGQEIAHLTYSH